MGYKTQVERSLMLLVVLSGCGNPMPLRACTSNQPEYAHVSIHPFIGFPV